MKYKFNEKSILFERVEKDENTMILFTELQHQLVLNSTGKKILSLLPNYSDSEEILEELMKFYPNIDKRVLESDLKEILSIFDIYDIISLDNSNISSDNLENITLYKITGDVNYKLVSKFIINALKDDSIKYYQESAKEYYSPLSLRMRTMQNYEYGVFAEKNGEILSYMSMSIPAVENCSVVIINSLFFKNTLSKDEIKNLINGMMNRLIRIISAIKPLSKARINFFKSHGTDEEIINIVKSIGFELECILKNETTYGDMKFYTLQLI
ncbi:hypothetical protein ACV3P1_01640 [Clostridium perfringens]|nr:hypothetical protein [Clostridium perfringens]